MRHNETHEEMAALAALSALEGEDARAFQAHLDEGCERCEEILAEMRNVSSALASSVRSRPPRAGLKAQIFDRINTGTGKIAPMQRKRSVSEGVAWFLAAAASLVMVFLGLDDLRLRQQRRELRGSAAELTAKLSSAERELAQRDLRVRVLESEDVRVLSLAGKDPQPQARARVFWSDKARRGILLAGNLASLPADKQYELWVFDQGKPVAAGVFDADAEGRAFHESPDLSAIAAAQNFAVTVEPRGGVAAPTGPIVLVGTPAA
ncbi:MAG TPA: anti-sigma factor [Thermoanaerobaculia bacterium]|jgi:anti-sigma-K factor RskA